MCDHSGALFHVPKNGRKLLVFFRATAYFIFKKSSYIDKQMCKLNDRQGENNCLEYSVDKTLAKG
jgi:hypothetical protein